jgi:hypothetical protein
MSSFKQLSRSDVTVVANNANKQWNLDFYCFPSSSQYLTIYKGTNLTSSFSSGSDPKSQGQYERLIYAEINQLFYQSYTASLNTASLASSIYYESASQQRPTSSYFVFNDNANFTASFPSGANETIRVIAINQSVYGNKVLPGSFVLTSSAYNVKDDSYGNLRDGSTHIGNIFYAQGLAVITNQDYQLMFPVDSTVCGPTTTTTSTTTTTTTAPTTTTTTTTTTTSTTTTTTTVPTTTTTTTTSTTTTTTTEPTTTTTSTTTTTTTVPPDCNLSGSIVLPTTTTTSTTTTTTTAPSYYTLLGPVAGEASTSGSACSNYLSSRSYYSNVNFMQSGVTYIYEDSGLTTPYTSSGQWKPLSFVATSTVYAVVTDATGSVTTYSSCP